MVSVFQTPGNVKNINRSVIQGVKLEELQINDERLKNKLQKSYPEGKVYVWGIGIPRERRVKKLWKSKWNEIRDGDYIIFYVSKAKNPPYFYSSRVLFKYPFDPENLKELEEAKKISKTIWENEKWPLLIFLEPRSIKPLDLDQETFMDIIGKFLDLFSKIYDENRARKVKKLLELIEKPDKYEPSRKPPGPRPKKDLLDRVIKAVMDRKQVILIGPPGSGKTNLAIWAAYELTNGGKNGYWDLVQFHRNYKYDDFVERMVLKTQNGILKLVPEAQLFVELCNRAQQNSEERVVLVIDEINRADVANVFGELIYALEYRGYPVKLAYSKNDLIVPNNLYIIATANDIDRGTFDIGVALRRRFDIIRIDTSEEDLKKMLQEQGMPENVISIAVNIFNRVNGLFEKHMGKKGVGHLFFSDVTTEEDLVRVWENRIKPLIEAYFLTSSIVNEEALNIIKDIDKGIEEIKSKIKSSP